MVQRLQSLTGEDDLSRGWSQRRAVQSVQNSPLTNLNNSQVVGQSRLVANFINVPLFHSPLPVTQQKPALETPIPIQGMFKKIFQSKSKTQKGKLVDKTGKLLAEDFTPSKKQLDTGTYWWDDPDKTWWLCPEMSTEKIPEVNLVDGETEKLLQEKFRPSNKQLETGQYLLDRSEEQMVLRWMYYEKPPF
ncbi:MAG: hypothetical protein HC851_15380 [Acaryochloris sp. RU_4_1]|nr:hypothetical protein [Acaryochloris sp. RU_4_1]